MKQEIPKSSPKCVNRIVASIGKIKLFFVLPNSKYEFDSILEVAPSLMKLWTMLSCTTAISLGIRMFTELFKTSDWLTENKLDIVLVHFLMIPTGSSSDMNRQQDLDEKKFNVRSSPWEIL